MVQSTPKRRCSKPPNRERGAQNRGTNWAAGCWFPTNPKLGANTTKANDHPGLRVASCRSLAPVRLLGFLSTLEIPGIPWTKQRRSSIQPIASFRKIGIGGRPAGSKYSLGPRDFLNMYLERYNTVQVSRRGMAPWITWLCVKN